MKTNTDIHSAKKNQHNSFTQSHYNLLRYGLMISIFLPVSLTFSDETAECNAAAASHYNGGVWGSTECGIDSSAPSFLSTAIGYESRAVSHSTAIGANSHASSHDSVAVGQDSEASAPSTTAVGVGSEASGSYSTVMGKNSTASGNNSTSMGISSTASGSYSTAIGATSLARTTGSTSTGYYSRATAVNSTAIGYYTQALGYSSTSLGYRSNASTHRATALGGDSIASGQNSTASGYKSVASGNHAIAIGKGSQALAQGGISLGANVINDVPHSMKVAVPVRIENDQGTAALKVLSDGKNPEKRFQLELENFGPAGFTMTDTSINGIQWQFATNESGEFTASLLDTGKDELILSPDGNLMLPYGSIIVGSTTLKVPDYVFANDYHLMPINEVEAFIEKNKHLPNVPSESEVKQAKTLDLVTTSMKHLEKIEELTLYTIQQHKQIKNLETKLDEQAMTIKAENVSLKKRLASLEKLVTNLAIGPSTKNKVGTIALK